MKTALAILFALGVSSTATAQDSVRVAADSTAPHEPLYRNPKTARVLAIVLPGAGYAYTGEYLRGYGTWVVTATGLMVGPIIFADECYGFLTAECGTKAQTVNKLTGSLLIATSIYTWIRSVQDAPKAAERANERRRRRELKAEPLVDVSSRGAPQLRAGLSVGW